MDLARTDDTDDNNSTDDTKMSYSTGAEISNKGNWRATETQALAKKYLIKAKPNSGGILTFPNCLVNKKVKIEELTQMTKRKDSNRQRVTKQEALDRIYIIKAKTKSGGYISFPDSMVGLRVSITEVEQ